MLITAIHMKRKLLFYTSAYMLVLLFLQLGLKAQTGSTDTSGLDTVIIDEKNRGYASNVISPKNALSQQEYATFIHKEFTASPIFKKNKLSAKLELAVVVEKDGTASAYTAKTDAPAELYGELIRILKMLPKRIPGTRDGKPARFRIYQPFEFSYKNDTPAD